MSDKSGHFHLQFKDDDNFNLGFEQTQFISTNDYEDLYNKPMIEGHELVGDNKLPQIGVKTATTQEIEAILYLG